MSGVYGEGTQYEMIFDTTTFATHKRHHALVYTGVDHTVESSVGAQAYTLTIGMSYAGIAFTDFPYTEMTAALAHPYDGQNLSVPYGGGDSTPSTDAGFSTGDMLTTLHRCRTMCIPQATVAAGAPVFIGNTEADHVAVTDTHDGHIQAADLALEQDEVDGCFGIAETGFTVPGTHADHEGTWNLNTGQYTGLHEGIWVSLWR